MGEREVQILREKIWENVKNANNFIKGLQIDISNVIGTTLSTINKFL